MFVFLHSCLIAIEIHKEAFETSMIVLFLRRGLLPTFQEPKITPKGSNMRKFLQNGEHHNKRRVRLNLNSDNHMPLWHNG